MTSLYNIGKSKQNFKKMFKYEPYFHKKAEKGNRKKKKEKMTINK